MTLAYVLSLIAIIATTCIIVLRAIRKVALAAGEEARIARKASDDRRLGALAIQAELELLRRKTEPAFVALLAVGRRVEPPAAQDSDEPIPVIHHAQRPWAVSPSGPIVLTGDAQALRRDGSGTVILKTNVPMTDIWIVALYDMQRVRMEGMFHGVDLLAAELGSCPVGHIAGIWLPGVHITATFRSTTDPMR